MKAIMIAATHSGAGKTTVTNAVLRALVGSGLVVQPFKIGPDFIDPMYHTEIAGRPSINLDFWLMGEEGIRRAFYEWSADADIVVIESMGAMFDGADGGDEGSAAHIARILGVPVIVVLNVEGMTRTTEAIMQGMAAFDPRVDLAGWILNRVGSQGHADLITRSLPEARRAAIVGEVRRSPDLEIAERHLGLVTVMENATTAQVRGEALDRAAAALDVERLLAVAERARQPEPPKTVSSPLAFPQVSPRRGARLAIARDDAFCFYYEENLRLLEQVGFEPVFFSPVRGDALPAADMVYIGGGYPESFADELAANVRLAEQLRDAADSGMPIYAECGGFMYLARSLVGFDGCMRPMAGVLPIDIVMDSAYLAIKYVEARTRYDSFFGPAGTLLRAQEFHQSRVIASDVESDFYDVTTSAGQKFQCGYARDSVIASYLHVHFSTVNTASPSSVNLTALFNRLRST